MEGELEGVTLGNLKRWPLSVRAMLGLVLGVLFVIYVFYPAYPTAVGKSLAGWTWAACSSYNGFLHGRLVPLIFPWLIWWAWKSKREEVLRPSYWGLVWLFLGLLLFLASVRAVQPRWALAGIPFVVIGLSQYLLGGRLAAAVIFPAFFWWFTIPVPGLEAKIMGAWQAKITIASYELGSAIGMDLTSEGSTIIANGSYLSIAEG